MNYSTTHALQCCLRSIHVKKLAVEQIMAGTANGTTLTRALLSTGYLAHGTATDYMYEKLKVPLSFTWEIYGDSKADFHDCFRMFNPLKRAEVSLGLVKPMASQIINFATSTGGCHN